MKGALAEAFDRAGFESPLSRLDRITREAIEKSPANWDAILDRLYAATRNDAALLWEIMGELRRRCYDAQIKRVQEEMRAERATKDGGRRGQFQCETQDLVATPRVVASSPARPASGGEAMRAVNPGRALPPAATLSRRDRGSGAAAAVARKSLLDTMMINGVKLRDVSVIEARKWGEARERDGRFIRNLLGAIPDVGKVGDYVTADMADAAMKLAEEAANA